MSEVVGMFPNGTSAERAVNELFDRGYDADSVGYLDRHRDEHGEIVTDESVVDSGHRTTEAHPEMGETEKGVTGGAVGGAAVGAGTGLLASAGMLLIPGIGPFLAAGSLVGTLTATAVGAAGGAAVGGVAGAIFDATDDDGEMHETSTHYRDGVASGKALVTVHVMDGADEDVATILRGAGAERVNVHGDGGWVS